MIRYTANINGIAVEARYSDRAVNRIFIPLLRQLTALQHAKGKRVLALLAAPPGAGKSTLASFLERISKSREELTPLQAVGMDGFHRRQEYLMSHTVIRDGQVIPMLNIKGAPVTFDLDQLTARIRRLSEGGFVGWPVYDRLLHNPVENVVQVTADIVILEGNYLLLNEDGWRDLASFADMTISITANEELLRRRLLERKLLTGVGQDDATRFVNFSDMANVRLCLQKNLPAHLRLVLDENGDYREYHP